MTVDNLQLRENPDNADWMALHALLHRAFAYMDGRINPPSSLHALTLQGLRDKASDEVLVTAHLDDTLVGCMFCRAETEWLYVGKVAVDPEHQGSGIGRKLFDRAFEMAGQQGLLGLELETRVELLENHESFAKLGFVKVGEDAHPGFDRPTSIRMRAEVKARHPR